MPGGGERPPAPVTVAVAEVRDVPVYIDEIGNTLASETVNIQSQVGGQIIKRSFKDGDELHAEQPLFEIDPRMFDAKVAEARANRELAETQLNLAQADYTRILQAASTGAATKEELDSKKAAVDTAKAQIKVNQSLLDSAELNRSYCTISSPIAGLSASRQVDVGNIVKANETTLVTIRRVSPIYADFTITERDLPQVREQLKKGTLITQVKAPPSDQARQGNLSFLDTQVMEGAGRVRLRATLTNEDRYFWPGQFVDVRLILRTIPHAVLIPYQCVQIGQQGPYVYVVDFKDNANIHPITLGQRQGDDIVVESGVVAGDRVVRIGQMAVTPGGKVRVVTPPATATAPASQPASAPASAPNLSEKQP